MTQEEQRTVVTEERTQAPGASTSGVATTSKTILRPSSGETTRRVVVLIFGIIQVLIGLRFVLLLIDADEANALVSVILSFSQIFVGPFEGILRTDALAAQGSVLDLAAIVAFVGWSILELIILWAVNIFRREPA
ncbi:MAG: hypothetical protein ACRDFR_00560 [Candidatus Limnocylindria bacterium]